MQDASHPIHRVRISYSKFSSPKTCRNIDKSSFKIGHIYERSFSLSNVHLRERRQWVFDTHARVVVSKLYDVTNMQTEKTHAHFSRVSFGEIL